MFYWLKIKNSLYYTSTKFKGMYKMEQKKIDRINELAKKMKTIGLTEEEKAEQAVLRREYIDSFKRSLTGQLDNMYIVDEKGNKTKVERKGNKK